MLLRGIGKGGPHAVREIVEANGVYPRGRKGLGKLLRLERAGIARPYAEDDLGVFPEKPGVLRVILIGHNAHEQGGFFIEKRGHGVGGKLNSVGIMRAVEYYERLAGNDLEPCGPTDVFKTEAHGLVADIHVEAAEDIDGGEHVGGVLGLIRADERKIEFAHVAEAYETA